MDEQEIRQIIEKADPEGKISQTTIEELVFAVKEMGTNLDRPGVISDSLEVNLKEQMKQETDWKKRAALAAQIISINLE